MNQKIPVPSVVFLRRVERAFPAYRYVPGVLPHPIRHPDGHLYKSSERFDHHVDWEKDEQFLYGADLFDARYFWESHENWEHCWHKSQGAYKKCIQGLIQISASILKHHMGSYKPRDTLFHAAFQKLESAPLVGWNFERLIKDTELFFLGGDWPLLGREFPRK